MRLNPAQIAEITARDKADAIVIDAWTDIIQRTIDAAAKDGQQGGTE